MAVNPQLYPHIQSEGFSEKSPATTQYNCIAWAAEDPSRWWWPAPGGYWPSNAPRLVTIDAFLTAFQGLGYTPCADSKLELGFEKIAIYALNGVPTHAARQLPSGKWTHKLGKNVDIESTLRGVESGHYGKPVAYLRRRVAQAVQQAAKRKGPPAAGGKRRRKR